MADQIIDTGITAGQDVTGAGTPPQGADSSAPQATDGTAQQDGNPPKQDVADWKKDQRYGRMWKDENGLYKSYTELEKVYAPLKEKYGTLEKQHGEIAGILKEEGIEPTAENIRAAMAELKNFKDPGNLANKRNTFLSHWLDDEARFTRYGKKIDDFFTQLTEQELLDDHPGLTREQALKQASLEKEQAELKRQLADIQGKEQEAESSKRMEQGLSQAKTYADKIGMPFTDDIRREVIQSCLDNGIPTALVFQEFLRLKGDAIEKAFGDKVRQDQLKELNKGKASVVPAAGSNRPSNSGDGKTSFKDGAMKALFGNKT